MFIPFEKLSPQSRIWIYQSDKIFSDHDITTLKQQLTSFTDQWLVHGAPIDASFDLRFGRFAILAANDPTSGCSIDTSVRVMKDLGAALQIDFFNRNLIAFKMGEDIRLIPLPELKKELAAGTWNADTLVFNNNIATLQELNTSWLVPANTTWLKRYLQKAESV